MTFDDDFCEFRSPEIPDGMMRARCKRIGVQWPPPEIIDFFDAPGMKNPKFRQVSRSQITDHEKIAAPSVMRGALYYPAELRH